MTFYSRWLVVILVVQFAILDLALTLANAKRKWSSNANARGRRRKLYAKTGNLPKESWIVMKTASLTKRYINVK